jgi:hypothetical protein
VIEKSHIALDTLKRVESRHPNLWSVADDFQQKFTTGRHLDGSVFSLAEADMVSKKLQRGDGQHFDPALLGALVAWRPTKGIYRFHPELYESLIETDLEGEVPSDVLLRMPSWAVFIETPVSENMPFQLAGFWAYLSRMGKQNELVLVGLWRKEGELLLECGIDPDWDILLFNLQLGHHPVSDLTEMMFQQTARETGKDLKERTDDMRAVQDHVASAMLSLLLYLCSEKPDISDWEPEQPQFKYLGKKRRWLASKVIREWDVGLRLGAALQSARERTEAAEGNAGNGTPVRPHVRRAHWHSFWVGKRGEQTISLRWLPPIPVNVTDAGNLPGVLHPVAPQEAL